MPKRGERVHWNDFSTRIELSNREVFIFSLLLRFLPSSKGVESEIFDFCMTRFKTPERRMENWKKIHFSKLISLNSAKLSETLSTKLTLIFSEGFLPKVDKSQACFSTWCEIALYANSNPTRTCESSEFPRKGDKDSAAFALHRAEAAPFDCYTFTQVSLWLLGKKWISGCVRVPSTLKSRCWVNKGKIWSIKVNSWKLFAAQTQQSLGFMLRQ